MLLAMLAVTVIDDHSEIAQCRLERPLRRPGASEGMKV
jgi:hypothetical protein